MNFRFSSLILGAMLTLFSFTLQAQGFGVTVDSAMGKIGHVSCLPVRALGFVNVVSFQYSLTWDAAVMTFDHTQDYNLPGWTAADFGSGTPGLLLVGWADPDGQPRNKANGEVLYQACFKVVGPLYSSTDILPGGQGFPPTSGGAEAYNANFENIWNPALNVPGYVEITLAASASDAGNQAGPSFQLSPNPTTASAQVLLKSTVAGPATLLVTDASGRTVLEQKISVKIGQNIFDIPSKVLNAKGMYQVSLQTDKGVSSQMLSVN